MSSHKTQTNLITFFSWLTNRPAKDQMIWIYFLSKLNNTTVPAFEIMVKTNTKIAFLRQIIILGNQYLESLGFEYRFTVQDNDVIITKIDVVKVPKKPRPSKEDKTQLRIAKHLNAIDEILAYLNTVTGNEFDSSVDSYISPIMDRLEEGYTIIQFKHVIEVKSIQWLPDPKMSVHLRPQTLFGTKMEGYALERIPTKQTKAERNAAQLQKSKSVNIFPANPNQE